VVKSCSCSSKELCRQHLSCEPRKHDLREHLEQECCKLARNIELLGHKGLRGPGLGIPRYLDQEDNRES
jgi:hypothetical protein